MFRSAALRVAKSAAFEVFGPYACRLALATHSEARSPRHLPFNARAAYYALRVMNFFLPLPTMMRQQEQASIDRPQGYDGHLLGLMVNRVYDLPEVKVDSTAPKRVNVLVPAFTVNTISAGFFGVFNAALFMADEGYRVRLVLFDNFQYDEQEFRKALQQFPSMERLFDCLEIEYIGTREHPLRVSPDDHCVATVWYSAYFARKIVNALDNRPFLYLIQDFEAAFHPFNSLYCLARHSYDFHYHTLASSTALLAYLRNNAIIPDTPGLQALSFDNAYSSSIYDYDTFMREKSLGKRRFVFYSRPVVNRNMFELAALALIDAYRKGAFGDGEWEFYGMGIGNASVYLADGVQVRQLPRMPLEEYRDVTKTFDLCLTLMASPHPSLIPMDLAAAGAIVVTNTFETKTEDYLTEISGNILPAAPEVESLSKAIIEGVARTRDLSSRYAGARLRWPGTWQDTWTDQHRALLQEVFADVR